MNAAFGDIQMPDRFVLECLTDAGAWIDWGLYRRDDFDRAGDGTYICAGAGSPLYLRCLRQDGSVLYVIDGAGDPFTHRLVPFPGGGYTPTSPEPAAAAHATLIEDQYAALRGVGQRAQLEQEPSNRRESMGCLNRNSPDARCRQPHWLR